jgi:hypothetical protein
MYFTLPAIPAPNSDGSGELAGVSQAPVSDEYPHLGQQHLNVREPADMARTGAQILQ